MTIPKCSDCVNFDALGCLICKVCEESFTKINFKDKNADIERWNKYADEYNLTHETRKLNYKSRLK
jgi:transcription elongation factor Elf1